MRWSVYLFFILIQAILFSACERGIRGPGIPTTTLVVTPTVIHPTLSPLTTTTTAISVTLHPTLQTLSHYQGSNPYREQPRFDVAYDSTRWSLVEDKETGLGDRLVNNAMADCNLRLQAGPLGALSVASVSLAGRAWTISQVQPNILLYWFRFEDIGFMFGLVLPEAYSPTSKGACQAQAEEIIDTFQIMK